MATVFQRPGSKTWIAAFRAWDAAAGKWTWKQKSTGTKDKAAASGIAARLEQASGAAKAGTMTREKALELVNDILRLAGAEGVAPVPSLENVAVELLDSVEVASGTLRKYQGHWATLAKWAGNRIHAPVSGFGVDDMQEFYGWCRGQFSGTTSNAHLNFASMLFKRAIARGHRTSNPTLAVARKASGAVEKGTFTRMEVAAILRAMRGRKDWRCLVALGWHTGHRIQDLLDLTADRVEGDTVRITPRKKSGRGREVVLPLPRWLARSLVRLGSFESIHHADNRNGKASEQFVDYLRRAGIDPLPVHRGKRIVHLKSFHSFRHSMASRLAAAGVSGELARLVTDHDSPKVARRYVHAEVQALREALAAARMRKSS